MKNILILLLMVVTYSSFSEIVEGGSTEEVNNKRVYISNQELLIRTPTEGLTVKEKLLRDTAIKLYQNPNNSDYTLDYLEIFPDNLDDFLAVFDNDRNPDIKLYSAIYIDLLKQAAIQHPEKGAEVLLGISKSACLKGDLMNYLQNALRMFTTHSRKNSDHYLEVNEKLTKKEQKTLSDFFKAKLYSEDGVGLCKE
ncbi:hypothetical protein [Bermanella sp. R86510]|uniref:hypothetical protein n=1 Tax=unclassified Bermanella TaxID=2627862 RepID=UPI0037C68EFA